MMTDHIQAVVWDFDGVHYRYDDCPEIYSLCDRIAAETAVKIMPGLDFTEAVELAKHSYQVHGTCLRSFVEKARIMGFDETRVQTEIFKGYHRNLFNTLVKDYAPLFSPNPETIAAFEAAPAIRHALATHSCVTELGRPMLANLGLLGFFEASAIHGLDDVRFRIKSTDTALVKKALRSLNVEARNAAFVEDSLPNLLRAKDIDSRLLTVYVHHGKPLDVLPSYVDLQTRNPASLMRLLAAPQL